MHHIRVDLVKLSYDHGTNVVVVHEDTRGEHEIHDVRRLEVIRDQNEHTVFMHTLHDHLELLGTAMRHASRDHPLNRLTSRRCEIQVFRNFFTCFKY